MGKVYSAAPDRTLLPPSLVIVYYYFATVRFLLAYFALRLSSKRVNPSLLFYCENPKKKSPLRLN
jgi:hypothetical protein